jgi:protein-tyrosine-phosphatase
MCIRVLGTCRAVLAESIFSLMLAECDQPLDVVVESASIGPAVDGQHDSRVVQVSVTQFNTMQRFIAEPQIQA